MDFLFILAIIFLPFDNLFFSPSNGWATISPILFFVYILFNYKYVLLEIKKYKKIFIFLGILFLLSIFNFIIHGFNLSAVFDTVSTLVMGLSTLLALDIYFIQKKNKTDGVIRILFIVYMISFIIGIIEFFTIELDIKWLNAIFEILSKRNYLTAGRIQYSFTEPSFIGMHLFGILLPVYLITKNKKILSVIICFIFLTLLIGSTVRFILDVGAVIAILALIYLIKNKKYNIILGISVFFIAALCYTYNTNYRIKNIIDNGVYADASLATRYFRIQSSVYGYTKDPISFITGYGMGNSILPLRKGYSKALSEYKSSYVAEIDALGDSSFYDSSVSFCLYIRLISEYGIIVFISIIYLVIKKFKTVDFKYKWEMLIILLYLYLQFDSYAFYSWWIFLFVIYNLVSKNNTKLNYKD